MVKDIVKGEEIFAQIPTDITKEDLYIYTDMVDTLEFNRKICIGMAGNMLGYNKKIISFIDEKEEINILINPVIIKKEFPYETIEGCLSLEGKRKCIRHKKIKVEYFNQNLEKRYKTFQGLVAEIIEHECDHLLGNII